MDESKNFKASKFSLFRNCPAILKYKSQRGTSVQPCELDQTKARPGAHLVRPARLQKSVWGFSGGWICSFGEHAEIGKGAYLNDDMKDQQNIAKILAKNFFRPNFSKNLYSQPFSVKNNNSVEHAKIGEGTYAYDSLKSAKIFSKNGIKIFSAKFVARPNFFDKALLLVI